MHGRKKSVIKIESQSGSYKSNLTNNYSALEVKLSNTDNSSTILQSGYRALKSKRTNLYNFVLPAKLQLHPQKTEECLEDAATKLQAGYFKMKTGRSLITSKKEEKETENINETSNVDSDNLIKNHHSPIKNTGIIFLIN